MDCRVGQFVDVRPRYFGALEVKSRFQMSIHWIRHSAGNQGDSLPAVSLGVGRTAKQISAGREHARAILDDDSAKCWGYNKYGRLGAV